MACQLCKSERILNVNGKCSDLCDLYYNNRMHQGYVPADLGIGEGDYLQFLLCMNCGQLQGTFPIPETTLANIFHEGLDDE